MTFAQMLTNVKGRCSIQQETQFDSLIRTWLNDAQRNLSTRFLWDFLMDYQDLTTVSGTEEYVLSQPCLVYDVTDRTNFVALRFVRQMEFDRYNPQAAAQGVSYFYRMAGQSKSGASSVALPKLQLYPVPGGTYTVRVRYYRRPADMAADTDVSEFPDVFHEGIVNYACSTYLDGRNDSRAVGKMDLYENQLMDLVAQFQAVPADEIDVLRGTDDQPSLGIVQLPPQFGSTY